MRSNSGNYLLRKIKITIVINRMYRIALTMLLINFCLIVVVFLWVVFINNGFLSIILS